MQPLQICIGPSSRINQESWCLPYAGFLNWGLANKKAILWFFIAKKNTKTLPAGGGGSGLSIRNY